jgi:hypothetical protein
MEVDHYDKLFDACRKMFVVGVGKLYTLAKDYDRRQLSELAWDLFCDHAAALPDLSDYTNRQIKSALYRIVKQLLADDRAAVQARTLEVVYRDAHKSKLKQLEYDQRRGRRLSTKASEMPRVDPRPRRLSCVSAGKKKNITGHPYGNRRYLVKENEVLQASKLFDKQGNRFSSAGSSGLPGFVIFDS